VCCALALTANAAPGFAGGPSAAARSGECPATPRLHDGFFARVETGLTLFRARARQPSAFPERTAIRALGQSTTLAAGATPVAGLVLAGSLWAARLDPTFYEHGQSRAPDDDSVKLTWARLAALVSYYPDPRRGFHVDASAGVALAVESDEKGNPREPGFAGPSAALALGQDWFVSSELSLGVSARATFSRVARSHEGQPEFLRPEMLELSFAYTYH
jgi:hypothetical protein